MKRTGVEVKAAPDHVSQPSELSDLVGIVDHGRGCTCRRDTKSVTVPNNWRQMHNGKHTGGKQYVGDALWRYPVGHAHDERVHRPHGAPARDE